MVTFDSPIERCPVCKEYVLLDQTQEECALEHRCKPPAGCPLKRYFEGIAFGENKPGRDSPSPATAAARPVQNPPVSEERKRAHPDRGY